MKSCAPSLIILVFACGVECMQAQQMDTTKRFFHLSAGLGVDAHSAPSIVDYINAVASPAIGARLDEFSSATEFFITPEIRFDDDWSIALEYVLFLKSYNVSDAGGFQAWEFSNRTQMPTLLLHYVIPGKGYWLKFGGGAGYASASFTQRYIPSGSEETFRTKGFNVKADVVANTEFDEHFYGTIGLDVRWCVAGAPTDESGRQPAYGTTRARINFFSVGAKFGILFQL